MRQAFVVQIDGKERQLDYLKVRNWYPWWNDDMPHTLQKFTMEPENGILE